MSNATLLLLAMTFPVGVTTGFFLQVLLGKHSVGCGAALASFTTMLGIVMAFHWISDIRPISAVSIVAIWFLLSVYATVIGAWVATVLAPKCHDSETP
ncbi:hypothetical protein [Massilia sp. CCM 8734]|uniref:hypothetical protein n=1 Tax=Massilia sp. CCM 8734 TaxID=2609283 RepID=UPI0014241B40|nr:hypothetical protein [Massilia sp. CCM 8734]NHZ99092.1 hypothetical protein [Massilia sp. CCM 8734]